jgi:hypothetical protein
MFIMDKIYGHLVCFIAVEFATANGGLSHKYVTLSKIFCDYSERESALSRFRDTNRHIERNLIFGRWEMREVVHLAE